MIQRRYKQTRCQTRTAAQHAITKTSECRHCMKIFHNPIFIYLWWYFNLVLYENNSDIKWRSLVAQTKIFTWIASLITKVSIQLQSTNENAKICACALCNSISGWLEIKNFGTELCEGKWEMGKFFYSSRFTKVMSDALTSKPPVFSLCQLNLQYSF